MILNESLSRNSLVGAIMMQFSLLIYGMLQFRLQGNGFYKILRGHKSPDAQISLIRKFLLLLWFTYKEIVVTAVSGYLGYLVYVSMNIQSDGYLIRNLFIGIPACTYFVLTWYLQGRDTLKLKIQRCTMVYDSRGQRRSDSPSINDNVKLTPQEICALIQEATNSRSVPREKNKVQLKTSQQRHFEKGWQNLERHNVKIAVKANVLLASERSHEIKFPVVGLKDGTVKLFERDEDTSWLLVDGISGWSFYDVNARLVQPEIAPPLTGWQRRANQHFFWRHLLDVPVDGWVWFHLKRPVETYRNNTVNVCQKTKTFNTKTGCV